MQYVLCDAAFGAIMGSLQVEEVARFEAERAEELRKLQVGLWLGSFWLAAVQRAALRWLPGVMFNIQITLLSGIPAHPSSQHFSLLLCTAPCCRAARPPRAGEAEPCHHEDAHQAVKGGGGSCRGAVATPACCCSHCLGCGWLLCAVVVWSQLCLWSESQSAHWG